MSKSRWIGPPPTRASDLRDERLYSDACLIVFRLLKEHAGSGIEPERLRMIDQCVRAGEEAVALESLCENLLDAPGHLDAAQVEALRVACVRLRVEEKYALRLLEKIA